MKKVLLLSLFAVAALSFTTQAATTMPVDTGKTATPDPPLAISGSVDTYFKSDFSGHGNIPTSFGNENSSISIGMVDLALKKKVGKAAFVGELSFGPRSDGSIPTAGYHIQNLYVSYDLSDKLNFTAGYMATFVGYEVISPVGNFNYSTSYLFTNGPFQNAGAKLTYAFSPSVSLMAGVFNDSWNLYTSATGKVNTFGAQLFVSPVKDWTAYINLVTGSFSGTEIDLTTAYQISSAFKLGLNVADFSASNGTTGGFTGVALYPQIAVSPAVTLGLRGEYFKTKTGSFSSTAAPAAGDKVTGLTLTANIKAGPLTFIPEFRLDNNSAKTMFTDGAGVATSTASQFIFAAVYAF